MTPLLLPAMTSQPSLPSIALQSTAVTGASEEEYDPSFEEELTLSSVRHFWSTFPCPPPWKPALLTEVNTSKLGPQVTRVITDFLAGKCQTHASFPGTRFSPDLGIDSDEPFGPNAETHLPESTGDITWCDRTCQLAIGCAGILMAMAVAVVALICFTRVRRPHKMASTRPSRQQLQLSTSTSDAVNWAEFSNTQIQFDEDMIYPPFRHRGLPAPPPQCRHPSCDPKWNCSSCSSCHPLMRMSPSVNTCTHGYTAVYETIDDDDDDATMSGTLPTRPPKYQASVPIQNWENGTSLDPSCPKFLHALSPGDSSSPRNDLSRANDCREEETGFNGDEVHRWPNYFELDHNYDQAHMNQPPVANRNLGMKSFQSPHQQKWVYHPSLAPTTFGKGPPATQMPCNQLCATCVPSVVSMTSCESIPRQNGYIPNGKIHNVSPHPQTLVCVSNVNATPHVSTLFPSTNIADAINSHIETESQFDAHNSPEHRFYFNQGCDFPQRVRPDQSHSFCPASAFKRHSKEDSHLATNVWRTPPTPTSCGFNTQDSDSVTSSPRHWCPTCQQVPLLEQFTTNRISAYGGSEDQCHGSTGSSWDLLGDDSRQTQNENYPNAKTENDRLYDGQEFKAEENSSSVAGQNSVALDCASQHLSDISQKPWPQDSTLEPSTGNEIDHVKNDNLGDSIRDSEQCPRVIALHSMYFNKTSTA